MRDRCGKAPKLARGAKKLEAVPDSILDEVLAKLAPIFE